METVTRNPSRKSNARKMAAKPAKETKAAVQSKPVVDVPNPSQKQITEFIKTNDAKLKTYLTETFEEISEKDMKEISKEVAECIILKRSPKAGGPWGSDTSIIEDTIRAVSGPKVVQLDPEEQEEDHGEEPDIDIESHHGDAPEEEDNGIEEASETPADNFETEAETKEPPQKTALSEPSKAAKISKTKSKTSPKKTATQKTTAKAKPKAVETKKAASPKTKDKKETKASTTPSVSVDQIKKLKGKEQWFAATKVLKSQKKIWIQTQDIPDVIGHLYNVSIGKEKLKEEGFEGKGEKVYRRNRILGFKETIESFIAALK